jgi:hypothetical protein
LENEEKEARKEKEHGMMVREAQSEREGESRRIGAVAGAAPQAPLPGEQERQEEGNQKRRSRERG